ncbi:TonB-linked outer membrane protein, SusC/RagA family [Flavobacterium resistens]|uniref:SusC/RagA family TonB-linked outer membrane protein n=1 Tax=Flavobacterium resistens TaxID=443612 RepID=A0A521F1U9_9FLAO|nr:TonB-dependent receptor [Flavobacterium resistens]MRX69436.1 SusC/RagA family TonB-linked outer membrane protein [Flavobacterium resistens]SMO90159.1 TonB-linked outer membrane protein, SusC/RagA family [Flavobacterium resistens]
MKNKLNVLLLIAMIALFHASGYAQNKVVKGTIKDAAGLPIPGANVLIKGSQNGVSTDLDGSYSINAASGNVLVYSFIGFKKQEITVGAASVYNVVLKEDDNSLEEVVVVGYGTKKKKDLTGSIVSVNAEEIASRPVVNAVQAMQGKAAGVDVSSNERPGSVGNITIRGARSISASNAPLYVVDGIPLNSRLVTDASTGKISVDANSGGIDFLNPTDIETIDVLKDASATAIYGSRGANGVIIVTTKKGKNGKFTLNYDTSLMTETIHENAPMMSAGEYIEFRRWGRYYSNPSAFPKGDAPTIENDKLIFLASADPAAWANIEKGWAGGTWDGSKVATTDWTKFVTRTGITQQHTIGVSGGTEKMKGYGSFGYLDNTGTLFGQSYVRYSGTANVDITPTKWFSMGVSLNTSYGINEYGQSNVGRTAVTSSTGIYATARTNLPYAVPYDLNGNRIDSPGGDSTIRTPVDEYKLSQDQRITLRAFGSLYAQFDLGAISSKLDGLKYRINFGPDLTSFRDGVYLDGKSAIRSGTSFASLAKEQTISYTLDNLIFYNKTFGNHSFGGTLLMSQTEYHNENSSMSANDIKNPENKWNALNPANVTLAGYSSGLTDTGLLSYMGRVNYSYADKYLFTASGRYDGASQLASENRWAFFPSASAAWVINKEKFLENVSWVNQLKMRVGYGVTGNAAVPAYATQPPLIGIVYPNGSGVVNNTSLGNVDLGWEQTAQFNYGIDFALFGNRVSGALDYFTSRTTDLLLKSSVPTVIGVKDTYQNVGETEGKGVELTLTTVNVTSKDFEWTTNISASYQQNKIVSLQNGKFDDINNNLFIGDSQNVIYGFESNGIWKPEDAAEMAKFNAAAGSNIFSFGNARPVDQNGDYKIDANNDRVIIGSKDPKYILGMTNTFSYKNFELSFFVYGRMGYLYDTLGENEGAKGSQRSINYYTDNNTNAEYQKPIYSAGTGDPYYPILGYRNGSFLKMRNISLGYHFDKELVQSLGLSKLRIYCQATNPGMIFTKVKWTDLDTQTTASNRGITLGLNVEF